MADSGASGKEAGAPVDQGASGEVAPGLEGGVADSGSQGDPADDGCSCRLGAPDLALDRAAPGVLLLLGLFQALRRRRAWRARGVN